MKSHNTIAGKIYTVTSPSGCTVTDETGLQLGSVEAGEQKSFVATGAQLSVDDDAARVTLTFNRAASVLGLLGGGVKSELPAGYLRAEFLESTGTQYINTSIDADLKNDVSLEFEPNYSSSIMDVFGWRYGAKSSSFCLIIFPTYMRFDIGENGQQNFLYGMKNGNRNIFFVSFEKKTVTLNDETRAISPTALEKTGKIVLFRVGNITGGLCFVGKFYKMEIHGSLNGVPALTADGKPCFFNKVDALPLTNNGKGQFIIGFTLPQARKLGAHLPAGGGELTVSLPTGYEQDAAVAESLELARAKGWTLTIQTYTHEAEAAAATFGMRRVWVRRTQDEHGAYVDADGTRWSVDWCVDMLTPDGSTPDQHGYELYRSTEAAVAYWELTPWVDPEAEELLTTESL